MKLEQAGKQALSQIRSQIQTKQKTVILIHGMWMSAFHLRFIGRQLTKKGWRVIYYDYSSMFTAFDENIDGLYQLWQKEQSDNTHLVAHSLGGLLILAMMKKYQLKNLPRSILMGSPVNGSSVVKKMLPTWLGKAMLGKSAQTLLVGVAESTAEMLASNHNKFGLILGDKGWGIGHMICRLPAPHDGVVSFAEADTEFAEDIITFPVTHATMLLSNKVAAAIDQYLSAGRFKIGDNVE